MKKRFTISNILTRTLLGLVFFAATSLLIGGCSSSATSPGTTSTVTATNDMQNTVIEGTHQRFPTPADGSTVDTLTITKVRVFMSGLHLHVSDETAAGVGAFQSQPTIVTFTPGAVNSLGSTTIPVGIYTQMIFDLHTPDVASDAGAIITNPDFVTVDKKYTIIIDGFMVKNGTRSAFSYKTAMVRNLKPVFIPSSLITVAEQNYAVNLRFDGIIAFAISSGGKPLDPTDTANAITIDNQIAKAFLAQH